MRVLIINILLLFSLALMGQDVSVSREWESPAIQNAVLEDQSLLTDAAKPESIHKTSLLKKAVNSISRLIDEINSIDSNYIEPQHFKFTVMLQNTNTFDYYSFATSDGRSITLSPHVRSKVGPYVGYSLIFLGFNLQLNNLYVGDTKNELDLSLYTPMFGIDMFYRNNGSDFNIRSMSLGNEYDSSGFRDVDFDGFNMKSKGINVYYIMNHRMHSYPATYNQSMCQKLSAGSPIIGLGWSRHSFSIDWERLDELVNIGIPGYESHFSNENIFDKVSFTTYSAYAGYSYNLMLAKNLWCGASLSLGLSYNHSESNTNDTNSSFSIRNFDIHSICLDGVGRAGIVWNNQRFYIGASGIAHSYRYRKTMFSSNNIFGNINIYTGVNFGKKKAYRKKNKFFEI